MISVAQSWIDAYEESGSILETKIELTRANLANVGTSNLFSIALSQADLTGKIQIEHGINPYVVGVLCNARLSFTIRGFAENASLFELPYWDGSSGYRATDRGVRVTLSVRVVKADGSTTAWVVKGYYYVASAEPSGEDLAIEAYDVASLYNYVLPVNASQSFQKNAIALSDINMNFRDSPSSTTVFIQSAKDIARRDAYGACAVMEGSSYYARSHFTNGEIYSLKVNPKTDGGDDLPSVTSEPIGVVATSTKVSTDQKLSIDGMAFSQGSNLYTTGSGNMFTVDVPSFVDIQKSGLIENAQSFIGNDSFVTNVIASDVVVSPLYELGDVLSIDLGDGTYLNFKPSHYTVTIDAMVFGEFSHVIQPTNLRKHIPYISETYKTASFVNRALSAELRGQYQLVFQNVPITTQSENPGALCINRYRSSTSDANTTTITGELTIELENGERQTVSRTVHIPFGMYRVVRENNEYVVPELPGFFNTPMPSGSTVISTTFSMSGITKVSTRDYVDGDIVSQQSEVAPVYSGGTGQTGVSSTSTISDVITAASGVTIGIARYSVWGKLATFYIRATPSSAKSGTWDVGTLPEGKRPADEAAFITGSEAIIGYITTAGMVKVVGSVSANANVYLKATYLLA